VIADLRSKAAVNALEQWLPAMYLSAEVPTVIDRRQSIAKIVR
jgi:hypothetical protein